VHSAKIQFDQNNIRKTVFCKVLALRQILHSLRPEFPLNKFKCNDTRTGQTALTKFCEYTFYNCL